MYADDQQLLVQKARDGDHDAWASLYIGIYPRLRAYAAARTDPGAAEDLVNETMARAVAGIHRFTWEPTGFDAWIFGIMRNVCLEHVRRTRRRRRDAATHVVYDGVHPGDAIELAEDHEAVRVAFEKLSRKDREILELRLISGLSVDQAAEVLGKRSGAVRTAQSRALANLRQLMEGSA